MLPDDYENLSQSVVASNLLSQNILSYITVSDYWSAVNDFKPLMHLWYVGILAEFYIIVPLLLLGVVALTDKINISRRGSVISFLLLIAIISFALYVGPWFSDGEKFYLLPCRLFELVSGGLIALLLPNLKVCPCNFNSNIIKKVLLILLTIAIYSSLFRFDFTNIGNEPIVVGSDKPIDDGLIMPKILLLSLTVLLSVIYVNSKCNLIKRKNLFFEAGKCPLEG